MHLDCLGHPIRVGDTVLTARYCRAGFDTTTKVLKVNKSTIVLAIDRYTYDYSLGDYVKESHSIKRFPYQMVVIDKQLQHNQEEFPEYML
jgi:hypothetical protein